MAIGSNTPKLRFPGFSGEWEIKKLGDIAKFSKGANISKDDIEIGGRIKAVRYGELYTTYSETINDVVSATNLSKNTLVFSQKNDVVIPASGETHIDIATAACVLHDGIALSGDINIIRTSNNGIFLAYYLNNKKKIDIARLAQGVSVIHLYSSNLKDLSLSLPSAYEQGRIAEFLTVVDERIAEIEKKTQLLLQYKKGVMQKMFTQKLRFKDENGSDYPDWQTKKLGDLAKIKTGALNVEDAQSDGKYMFFDRSEQVKKYDEYSFDNEALIYAGEGSKFLPRYFAGKYGLHQRAYSVFDAKGLNMKFLYYFMFTQNNHFLRMAVGSTVKSLRMDCFSKCAVPVPGNGEQQKIADFLTSLDEKIELTEGQLAKAKAYKNSLLQRMFV